MISAALAATVPSIALEAIVMWIGALAGSWSRLGLVVAVAAVATLLAGTGPGPEIVRHDIPLSGRATFVAILMELLQPWRSCSLTILK